jgi:hypothetical protein
LEEAEFCKSVMGFGLLKRRGLIWTAERLQASQEEFLGLLDS